MKIALAMIVKGTDEEADRLKDCLNSVRNYVDGAFITITQPNEKVESVCEFFDCETSSYEWDDHFANARNHSFEQVPDEYDYILWLDADDVLENAQALKETIENNPADAYSLWYLYALDENDDPVVVHRKTQIVKNDGSFYWQGRLHEDIATNREIKALHIDDIRRVHLSNEPRFNDAKGRNLRIAEKQVEDTPDDARAYWNLGNSQKSMGHTEEALETFSKFIEESGSDDEKYVALIRSAECLYQLNREDESEEMFRKAIGLKPDYPDAYIGIGKLFYKTGQLVDARQYLKQGLQKDPPYMDLIVYNPREYDLVPMKYLALTYVDLGQMTLAYEAFKACLEITPNNENIKQLVTDLGKKSEKEKKVHEKVEELMDLDDKEKIKEGIENIDDDFKDHPLVCRLRNKFFVKEESSGKDIVYYCGKSSEEWTPKTAEEDGIGGSEEAVINLSRQWTDMGYNVTVYNNCGYKTQEFDGVTYKPYWSFNPADKQDVLIIWRIPGYLQNSYNADKVYLDMHDALNDAEFTEERLAGVDKVFLKSQFHREIYPSIPDEKIVIAPNGINPDKFNPDAEKDEKLLINTSSPDRSISALVKGFKLVKEEVPDAKLKWAYGWNVFDNSNPNKKKKEWKAETKKLVENTEDFEVLGRISHDAVADLYNEAAIFAYPTEFAEIDCISITKALAAGAVPVTTDFSAIGEKMQYGGTFIKSDKTKDNWLEPGKIDFALEDDKIQEWADAVVEQLKNPDKIDSDDVKKDYAWETIAKIWTKHF